MPADKWKAHQHYRESNRDDRGFTIDDPRMFILEQVLSHALPPSSFLSLSLAPVLHSCVSCRQPCAAIANISSSGLPHFALQAHEGRAERQVAEVAGHHRHQGALPHRAPAAGTYHIICPFYNSPFCIHSLLALHPVVVSAVHPAVNSI